MSETQRAEVTSAHAALFTSPAALSSFSWSAAPPHRRRPPHHRPIRTTTRAGPSATSFPIRPAGSTTRWRGSYRKSFRNLGRSGCRRESAGRWHADRHRRCRQGRARRLHPARRGVSVRRQSQHLQESALRYGEGFYAADLRGQTQNLLVVKPSMPINPCKELIDYARKNPGKVSYGSTGIGSSNHLSMELFKSMAGIDIMHVPYKGSAPMVNDLLGGHIDISLRQHAERIAPGQCRQVARAWSQQQDALGARRKRADGVGGGRTRIRGYRVVRHRGTSGHAAGTRAKAECRDECDLQDGRCEAPLRGPGRRTRRRNAFTIRGSYSRRDSEMGQGCEGRQHSTGVAQPCRS